MAGLRKIEVTTGVYWVEAPEAGLRCLCGCPADSVKHLMRRGLILDTETGGVRHETGPNAILLSDVLIQNGAFANLAEFPVLQMLYRQGLILPGHPMNTGRKPMLIGSDSQVRAQMRYIYRGNYGLVSEEELTAAGYTKKRAAELMRMKLRFAFGSIRETSELLEACIVGEGETQVMDGVGVVREGLNVFSFRYKGESVRVDLNLPPGVRYPSPYNLGFRDIGREYFAVVHSGDGDGWDTRRPAMASLVMHQGQVFLIDAGPNLVYGLTALGIGVNEISGVFHTHCHDDHFCGLTTLMRADHRIRHYATPQVRASVIKKWSALVSRPEGEFQNYFDCHDLAEGRWNDMEGLEVKPVFSPHPVETTVMLFRARTDGGYKCYAHMADIVSRRVLSDFVEEDPDKPGVSRALFERTWRDYRVKADVKKLDIGGGLIHGEAQDFAKDKSGKLILAHTALDLTDQQKEIGSGAPFGMVDILIEGRQDFVRSRAYHYLEGYLPGVPRHQLKMLMNNVLETVNPETILLPKGEAHDYMYLIVTGVVEMIDTETGTMNRLSAGAMAGELSGITGGRSRATFRAATYVRALKLPCSLYSDVVEANGLMEVVEHLRNRREFLQRTWLFGESISTPVQNTLAGAMRSQRLGKGESLAGDKRPAIYLVKQGEVDIALDGLVFERLKPGDFYGEGCVLFTMPCLYTATAATDASLYRIPGDVLLDVPVVRWKLFEAYERRMDLIMAPNLAEAGAFAWRESYAVGHETLDAEHRELFAKAEALFTAMRRHADVDVKLATLDGLIDYAEEHFVSEEKLMKKAEYPQYEEQVRMHRQLLADVRERRTYAQDGLEKTDLGLIAFLKEWILDHILTEDRRLGAYLAHRKVF